MQPHSLSIEIYNLRVWRRDTWLKYDKKITSALVKIHYDQLLIISGDKILESLSLCSRIKGINKQDHLVLIISTSPNEIRKIKFQIKSRVKQSLKELGSKFPIVDYNSSNQKTTSKFQLMSDVLRQALENNENLVPLPHKPAISSFVKLCLLDPQFPEMVMQIQEVLKKNVN